MGLRLIWSADSLVPILQRSMTCSCRCMKASIRLLKWGVMERNCREMAGTMTGLYDFEEGSLQALI